MLNKILESTHVLIITPNIWIIEIYRMVVLLHLNTGIFMAFYLFRLTCMINKLPPMLTAAALPTLQNI